MGFNSGFKGLITSVVTPFQSVITYVHTIEWQISLIRIVI